MSVQALDPDPTIKIIFRGLTITHIRDDEPVALIGAIDNEPCHEPKIRVDRVNADGSQVHIAVEHDFDLDQDIFLDVENTSRPDIQTLEKADFDRSRRRRPNVEDEEEDFRYFIDLKRDVMKDTPFSIDQSKLKPVFHVQRAVFYSLLLTGTKLVVKRPEGDEPLGFGAENIAARIKLDQPNSKAVLRNGNKVILTVGAFDVEMGRTYVIDFNCECPPVPLKAAESEFILVYKAIAGLSPDQRVNIHGEEVAGATGTNPQVLCTGGNG